MQVISPSILFADEATRGQTKTYPTGMSTLLCVSLTNNNGGLVIKKYE